MNDKRGITAFSYSRAANIIIIRQSDNTLPRRSPRHTPYRPPHNTAGPMPQTKKRDAYPLFTGKMITFAQTSYPAARPDADFNFNVTTKQQGQNSTSKKSSSAWNATASSRAPNSCN